MWIEILGYAASVIVMLSLMVKSLVKLRCLNAAGSLLFVTFALITKSYPTAFLNAGMAAIDIYFLIRLLNKKDSFEMVPVSSSNEIVAHMYAHNKNEIDTLFGADALSQAQEFAFYFRNNDIAGFIAYAVDDTTENKTARILIDFVTAKYRDVAVGTHFFVKDLSFWHSKNIAVLRTEDPAKMHIPYLRKIGFSNSNDPRVWQKNI